MKLIAEGAEARVYRSGGKAIKERLPKKYRLQAIDERLRRARTRREARIMTVLEKMGLKVPSAISVSDKTMTLEMSWVEGKKLRDVITGQNSVEFGAQAGRMIGIMHRNNIVHCDLTTSNMIVRESSLWLIDFGLSFVSGKSEDKAVDLHLLKQALDSSHPDVSEECFAAAVRAYCENNPGCQDVLARLEKVEQRGRHKAKA
ncbi:Kae1-associated serine/threonine protein kinase [Candidatus Woesearchaeota archaeon]|nr:Kae1-associated serine/threonine protein kinase [Candidatus Woesearchaeota archaeon]